MMMLSAKVRELMKERGEDKTLTLDEVNEIMAEATGICLTEIREKIAEKEKRDAEENTSKVQE